MGKIGKNNDFFMFAVYQTEKTQYPMLCHIAPDVFLFVPFSPHKTLH